MIACDQLNESDLTYPVLPTHRSHKKIIRICSHTLVDTFNITVAFFWYIAVLDVETIVTLIMSERQYLQYEMFRLSVALAEFKIFDGTPWLPVTDTEGLAKRLATTSNFAVMLATLTIPAKQSPFPYAAAAIAAYTGKANIDIEGSASAINLEIDGSSINEEETIVQILAKEFGLSEDSEKAIIFSNHRPLVYWQLY